VLPNGIYEVTSFWGLLLNPWAWRQFAHNMSGAVITGAFVMCAVGAFYLFQDRFSEYGRIFLRVGVVVGLISSIVVIFPTGDMQGKYLARTQPAAMAGMEGLFDSAKGAPIVLMGQLNVEEQHIDNPIAVNKILSLLIYGNTASEVAGLNSIPKDQWPTNLPLLFFAYHIMAGLGTYFAALMALSAYFLWRGSLFKAKWLLWPLLLSFPLPYIANTAGWMTAEVGRQPWLVYGLIRTAAGYSKHVSSGNILFTLLGFMGLYSVLSILFLLLIYRVLNQGPVDTKTDISDPPSHSFLAGSRV
jgi:cytochrome d ubiquinol oxidase subunit I